MCQIGKDQTKKEVFEFLKSKELKLSSSKGFGIFLIPDPEKGVLEWKKIAIEDITYREVIKRGQHCAAFQWVPCGIKLDAIGSRNACAINSLSDVKTYLLEPGDCNEYNCPSGVTCPAFGCFCSIGGNVCE